MLEHLIHQLHLEQDWLLQEDPQAMIDHLIPSQGCLHQTIIMTQEKIEVLLQEKEEAVSHTLLKYQVEGDTDQTNQSTLQVRIHLLRHLQQQEQRQEEPNPGLEVHMDLLLLRQTLSTLIMTMVSPDTLTIHPRYPSVQEKVTSVTALKMLSIPCES